MAVELLKHAINMILNNIGEAVKASLVPMIALIVVVFAVGGTLATGMPADPTTLDPASAGPILFSSILMLVAYLLLFSVIAVTWHRYILLAEMPGFVPVVSGKNVGPYIVQLIKIFLILVALGVAIGLVAALVGALIPFLAFLVGFAMVVVLSIVYLRLAVTLPSVAVGEALSIGDAWERTKPHAQTFVGIFFLLMLLRILMALPGFALSAVGLGIVAIGIDLLANWFVIMVGIGILTTLYGNIIEGRPLN